MVKDAPEVEEVLGNFTIGPAKQSFVAHNASFDMGFINTGYQKIGLGKAENPVIDTLELARFLYPQFTNHRLNTLAKRFDIELVDHHRAIYDAEATGYLLLKILRDAKKKESNTMINLMTIWVKEMHTNGQGQTIAHYLVQNEDRFKKSI